LYVGFELPTVLQCFDIAGWVAARAPDPQTPVLLVPNGLFQNYWWVKTAACDNKKLCYRRRTARRAVSVEILSSAAQLQEQVAQQHTHTHSFNAIFPGLLG